MDWIKNRNSYKHENDNKTLVCSITPHYKDCQKVSGVFDVGIAEMYPDGAYSMKTIRQSIGIRGLKNAKQWGETWLALVENGSGKLSGSESFNV